MCVYRYGIRASQMSTTEQWGLIKPGFGKLAMLLLPVCTTARYNPMQLDHGTYLIFTRYYNVLLPK